MGYVRASLPITHDREGADRYGPKVSATRDQTKPYMQSRLAQLARAKRGISGRNRTTRLSHGRPTDPIGQSGRSPSGRGGGR